jgi:hypothetical protein
METFGNFSLLNCVFKKLATRKRIQKKTLNFHHLKRKFNKMAQKIKLPPKKSPIPTSN